MDFYQTYEGIQMLLYNMRMETSDIRPAICVLTSKINDIKLAFSKAEDNKIHVHLNDILQKISSFRTALMETENIEPNNDIAKSNVRQIAADSDTVNYKQINKELTEKISSMELDYIESHNRLLEEKLNNQNTIKLLNSDLDLQIQECIESTTKLTEIETLYTSSKVSLTTLMKELYNLDVVDDITLPDMISSLYQSIIAKKAEDESHQNVSTDAILDDFDIAVFEELHSLHSHDTSELIKNASSIVIKSIVNNLNYTEDSRIVAQLKRIFAAYEDVLSRKLVNIQDSCDKMKEESATRSELVNAVSKVDALNTEKSSLEVQMIELREAKERSEALVSSLKLELTNLALKNSHAEEMDTLKEQLESLKLDLDIKSSELVLELENLKESQRQNEELRKLNSNFESSSIAFEYQIEELNNRIKVSEDEYQCCLSELKLSNERYSLLINEDKNLREEMEELRQSSKDKIDEETFKILKDKIETLDINLRSVTDEKEFLKGKFDSKETELSEAYKKIFLLEDCQMDYENKITSKEEELRLMQTNLDNLTLEFEKMIDENILVTEELESNKSKLNEKEELLENVKKRLESNQKDLEIIEKDNANLRKKCSDFIEQTETLQNKLDIELMSSNEERNKMMCNVDELTKNNSSLKEEIVKMSEENQMNEEKLFSNERKIEHLESNLADCATKIKESKMVEMDLRNSLEEKTDEINRIIKDRDNMVHQIENTNVELEMKESEIRTLKNNVATQNEQLTKLGQELATCLEHVNEKNEGNNHLEELKKELKSRDSEVANCKSEIEYRDRQYYLMQKKYADSADASEQLQILKNNLAEVEFELRSFRSKYALKESETNDLKNKLKEAVNAQFKEKNKLTKVLRDFENYKENHEINSLITIPEDKVDSENASKVTMLTDEIKRLKDEMTNSTTETVQLRAEYEELKLRYEELKKQYIDKRRRTEDLQAKYAGLVKLCKAKNVDITKYI